MFRIRALSVLTLYIFLNKYNHTAHARAWRKMKFLAVRSYSQTLVDTQKLVAPQQFHDISSCSCVRVSCVLWKKYFFDNFQTFFAVFNHANAYASMRSLVEIHNKPVYIKHKFVVNLMNGQFVLFNLGCFNYIIQEFKSICWDLVNVKKCGMSADIIDNFKRHVLQQNIRSAHGWRINSGYLNTNHLNTGNIWITNLL